VDLHGERSQEAAEEDPEAQVSQAEEEDAAQEQVAEAVAHPFPQRAS
jgi:hypothetical protein